MLILGEKDAGKKIEGKRHQTCQLTRFLIRLSLAVIVSIFCGCFLFHERIKAMWLLGALTLVGC